MVGKVDMLAYSRKSRSMPVSKQLSMREIDPFDMPSPAATRRHDLSSRSMARAIARASSRLTRKNSQASRAVAGVARRSSKSTEQLRYFSPSPCVGLMSKAGGEAPAVIRAQEAMVAHVVVGVAYGAREQDAQPQLANVSGDVGPFLLEEVDELEVGEVPAVRALYGRHATQVGDATG